MKKRWKEGRGMKVRRGEESHNWLGLSREWILEELERFAGRPKILCDAHGIDYATLQKYMTSHEIDFYAIKRTFNVRGEKVDCALLSRAIEIGRVSGVDAAQRAAGLGYYTLRDAQARLGLSPAYNHIVVAVEALDAEVAVYDLEVEDVHNFIAGEICVHNCQAPNWQNPPRKGGVRECIIPRG